MKTIRPTPSGHQTASEFVNDDHLAIFDHVLDVAMVKCVRLDGGFDVVFQRPVLGIGNVADAKKTFYFHPAFIGNRDVAMLLIHHVIAGVG